MDVQAHTPLAYYVVTNHKWSGIAFPWNTLAVKELLQKNLGASHMIYSAPKELTSLVPKGIAIGSRRTSGKSAFAGEFAVPDYLPGCGELTHSLNQVFHSLGSTNVLAKCVDINNYIDEKIHKQIGAWYGFLTPLSPGAPGRNEIAYQYFSPDSHESWTGKVKNSGEYYYLVGMGQSLVTVDGERFCGLNANPMGLGDVFLTDFRSCEK